MRSSSPSRPSAETGAASGLLSVSSGGRTSRASAHQSSMTTRTAEPYTSEMPRHVPVSGITTPAAVDSAMVIPEIGPVV